jgi:hypothetical protein
MLEMSQRSRAEPTARGAGFIARFVTNATKAKASASNVVIMPTSVTTSRERVRTQIAPRTDYPLSPKTGELNGFVADSDGEPMPASRPGLLAVLVLPLSPSDGLAMHRSVELDWTRTFAVVNYEQAVERPLVTLTA